MARDREASLKVGVKSGGFVSGLRRMRSDVDTNAKEMGASFRRHLSAGIAGGLNSIGKSLSSLKGSLSVAMGNFISSGVAGMKDGIMHAVKMEATYRRLAFGIRAGTGEAVKWQDIQRQVQQTALATGNSTEELAGSFEKLFQETGSADFAGQAMKSVAMAATASGQSVASLSAIAGTLNEKFGITGQQMDAALRTAISLGNKGGVSVEDLADKLGVMGAFAKSAGLEGEDGFKKMAALMNIADNSTGNLKKGIAAIGGLLETLGTKAERSKALMKLGIDPSSAKGDATKTIGEILKKTGGSKDKLAVAFQGEQLKVLTDLGKTYAEAFASTEGDVKKKTAAALAALDAAFTKAGESTLTEADMKNQFAEQMSSTEKNIQTSLTRLEQAFGDERVTKAVGDLAKHLPELAKLVASAVSFAVESPVAAGGLAVGALGAKGLIGSVITGAFTSGAASAAPSLASGIAGGGAKLASAFGGALGGAGVGAILAGLINQAIAHSEKEEQEKSEAIAAGKRHESGGGGDSGAPPTAGHFADQRDMEGNLNRVPVDDSGGEIITTKLLMGEAMERARKHAEEQMGVSLPRGGAGAAPEGEHGGMSQDPTAFYRDAPRPSAAPDSRIPSTVDIRNEVKVRVVNLPSGGGGGGPVRPGHGGFGGFGG